MITQATVEHFQSLDSAQVDLGKLTVIVGQSSTGKSAFLRALRTLVRNTASTAAVTHGSKSLSIAAQMDGTTVGVERGKALSTYQVTAEGKTETYAKAGTQVPEDVAKALRMPLVEDQDLNFAFQFDRPFLLSDPPAKAAKVLGDLTNVTTLSEAAREANRRRLDASKKLAIRKSDLGTLTQQMQPYKGLPARAKAIHDAQIQVLSFREQVGMSEGLRSITTDLISIAAASEAAQQALDSSELPVAAVEDLETAVSSTADLRATLTLLLKVAKDYGDARGSEELAEEEELEAQHAYLDLLRTAGTCPTCGQNVETLEEVAS